MHNYNRYTLWQIMKADEIAFGIQIYQQKYNSAIPTAGERQHERQIVRHGKHNARENIVEAHKMQANHSMQ